MLNKFGNHFGIIPARPAGGLTKRALSLSKGFFVGFVILASCETEKIIFDSGFHVRFTETSLSEKESNNEIIKIEIHNAGPAHSEDVTVSYAMTGDAREGIDFEIVGTKGQVTGCQ